MSVALALVLALGSAASLGHPMHTAVAEVGQQDAGGMASIGIRVFAADWQTIGLPSDGAAADSAAARYLRGTFAIADRRGRPVRLTYEGAERAGDVVLLRLRGRVPGGLAGARVTSLVLCDRFPDQVNIVRATYDARAVTLLFTRGEVAKALR